MNYLHNKKPQVVQKLASVARSATPPFVLESVDGLKKSVWREVVQIKDEVQDTVDMFVFHKER